MRLRSKFWCSASSVLVIAACGTGGEVSNNAPNVGFQPSGLQGQIPLASYTQGSDEKLAFDLINSERGRCGFGMVAQKRQLDLASAGHLNYLLTNNQFAHTQDQVLFPKGFTGRKPEDRALREGYGTEVSEALSGIRTPLSGTGRELVLKLMTAPYHLADMFRPHIDMGVSFVSGDQSGNFASHTLIAVSYGFRTKQQVQELATFPCEGTKVGLTKSIGAELPNPIAGRDLGTQPIGHPIYVRVAEGKSLLVTQHKITKQGSFEPLALLQLSQSNDLNQQLSAAEALIIPTTPLDKNAQYRVELKGTIDSKPFDRAFEFATGDK